MNDGLTRSEKVALLESEGIMTDLRVAPPPGEAKATPWEAPIPFEQVSQLPDFPVQCLPEVVRAYAQAVAESVQVSVDMAAVAILPAVALCVQKKFRIEGKPGWREPLNLYAMIVAPPAERKSAIAELLTRPIRNYEKRANKLLQMEIDYYESQKDTLERELKVLTEKAVKGAVTIQDVAEKRNQLSTLEEVRPLRLWADNATMEAIISLMADNDGRTAVISAEGGVFDIMAGRYSNGTDVDVYLKAHAGDSIRVDRKGRQSEYIDRPAMTMLLYVQPVVLDGIMHNEAFRGRGLVARFLYALPNSKVGNRAFETAPIPWETEAAFNVLLQTLLDIPMPEEEHVLTLSPEAHRLSAAFFYWLEPQLKGELEGIGDWAGKLHGAILRIAGVCHMIQRGHTALQESVGAETMENAITIGKYFLEHAKAAYKLMGADERVQGARYILQQIEKDKPTEITRSNLTRLCRGRFRQAEDMEPAIVLLLEHGYFRKAQTETKGNNRTQTIYKINPLALGNCGISGICIAQIPQIPEIPEGSISKSDEGELVI